MAPTANPSLEKPAFRIASPHGYAPMTKKRYPAVAGLLTILVCAGFGVGMMMSPTPGVTKAKFDRIKKGMTIEEVERIFGNKYDEEGWKSSFDSDSPEVYQRTKPDEDAWTYFWKPAEIGSTWVSVSVDNEGIVCEKIWHDELWDIPDLFAETYLQKLRRCLRL